MKCAINCLGCESGNPEEQKCLSSTIMDESRARDILGEAYDYFGAIQFRNISEYHKWYEETGLYLDGNFTADELEAIAWWMRNKAE